ncbi:TlpA family protein disulfide reductase [Aureivirga marina]|uniref:TlpA family protein disulfide reductase n=1 Tax=Aureivirga marina TaxID=1182451 RepID=UPI0018CA16A4|nr:TlpA disulfide reductase family protein [Aureivirga marina]
MKKLTVLIAAFAVFACNKEAKDYVTFEGKIVNKNSDTLTIKGPEYEKKIALKQDGSFQDTLHVKTGVYTLFDGKDATPLYLKDGFEIQLDLDTKNFDESIKYKGEGANANNYLAEKIRIQNKYLEDDSFLSLNKKDYEEMKKNFNSELGGLLDKTTGLDSIFISDEKREVVQMNNYIDQFYNQKQELLTKLAKGTPSPVFNDYEDYSGGTKSLADFKGKFVYIDIWATWCGPCIKEIPALKEVEKKYHDKNITFISISVDSERDHEKWKTMVKDENLSGVQLFANPADQTFFQQYFVSTIPRFILLDPQGNIVNPDAPRPSSEKLIEIFNDLKI